MPIHDFVCGNAHISHDHLHKMDDNEIVCPECGQPALMLPAAPRSRISRTDFVDAATGRRFKTEQDCTNYCRAAGLSDNEMGRFHAEANIRAQEDAIAKDENEFQKYTDRLQHDPDFAGVRQLMDSGFYQDKAKESLKRAGHSDKLINSVDLNLINKVA